MNPHSLSIFSKATYDCLKQRPYISQIVKSLKEALEIQWKHENLLRMENFAYLKIPLKQIRMATDNFARTYRFKLCKDLYKAELDDSDRESAMAIEGENKGELSKKTVIIKRITRFNKYNKTRKDFFAEIEMLASYKHPNLFSFLGFCDEDSEMILVFEYDLKENLQDYLRNTNMPNLTWEQRISICLDITHGLKYLHNPEGKPSMIHQVILSRNVFLDEKWTAKIANFKLYKLDLKATPLWRTRPENFRTWLLGQRLVVDDIYALGVILFEILTGRLAYDPFYVEDKINQLTSMGLRHFVEGKLKSMADPRIMEEIIYQCLALETPGQRSTFEVVIKSLEKALHIQVQKLGYIKIPLEDIKLATNNFDINCGIGSGGYGEVYKAKLKMKSKDEPHSVAIKRITSREDGQGFEGFLAELDAVSRCHHPNIVSLLGFCVEDGEMLLVYEFASNGSLDDYLGSTEMINLTWVQRLKLCIDIAQGLKYMHATMEDKKRIIHRDIKSANILLGKNWEAKIADFGLSKVHHGNQMVSSINTHTIAGTDFYLDPEYSRTGRLKKASDVYSLGVVLFEIFSGKLAYDQDYIKINMKGLVPIARRHFKKGTIKDLLDPKIMDEAYELGLNGKVKPDHDSLDVFSRIAYHCVAKTQIERPTIEVVTEELDKALHFQENRIKTLKFSLEHIKLGVGNFSDDNRIMKGGYGMLYKGKVQYNSSYKKVTVKRFTHDRYFNDATFSSEHGFMKEFEVLFKYKHENIIALIGYCKEMNEKIILYEHASNRSLDRYLKDTSFSWTKRLKICIDIANGLKFLHGGDLGQELVIHRDIKSSNILLNKDWKAKICGFELALILPTNQKIEYIVDNVEGSPGYSDPLFLETQSLTKEYDIYSFGVILFEILCGRLACPKDFRELDCPDVLVKCQFQVARLEEIVFEGIKEKIAPKSLATFRSIAFKCLHEERKERPPAGDVVVQLLKALEFQEAYEAQEAILHRNYTEISTMTKKDIYNILSKGFLLEDDKLEIIRFLEEKNMEY